MLSHMLGSVGGYRTGCSIFRQGVDGFYRLGTCHSSKLAGEWQAVGPLLLPARLLGKGLSAVLVAYEQSDRAYN